MDQTRPLSFLFAAFALLNGCSPNDISFTNPVRFPPGSPFMGIGVAVSSSIDQDLSFAIALEVAYGLPKNEDKEFAYPPIITKRSLERKYVYRILETRLEKHGFSGKTCLLRAICEAAEYSFLGNGLLGDIVHIVLTPSSSRHEPEREYKEAENYAKRKGHCRKYREMCKTSIVDLISVLKESFVYEKKDEQNHTEM